MYTMNEITKETFSTDSSIVVDFLEYYDPEGKRSFNGKRTFLRYLQSRVVRECKILEHTASSVEFAMGARDYCSQFWYNRMIEAREIPHDTSKWARNLIRVIKEIKRFDDKSTQIRVDELPIPPKERQTPVVENYDQKVRHDVSDFLDKLDERRGYFN